MEEELRNHYDANAIMLSTAFLEDHLQDADPYFIKVYLYYLWHNKEMIEVKKAADALNLTDNDIERAVKYWASKKVLPKDIIIKENEVYKKSPNLVSFKEKKEEMMARKDNDDEFNGLIFFAEKLLPNTISSPQLQALSEMYYTMKLPCEVIEYLIEYIAQNETYSSKYMLTIATSWYEQGIKTRNEAKTFTEKFSKDKKTKKTKGTKKVSKTSRSIEDFDDINEIVIGR